MKINIDQKNNKITIDLTPEEMNEVAVNGVANLFPTKIQYIPTYTSPSPDVAPNKKDWGDDEPFEWWKHPVTCTCESNRENHRQDAREEL